MSHLPTLATDSRQLHRHLWLSATRCVAVGLCVATLVAAAGSWLFGLGVVGVAIEGVFAVLTLAGVALMITRIMSAGVAESVGLAIGCVFAGLIALTVLVYDRIVSASADSTTVISAIIIGLALWIMVLAGLSIKAYDDWRGRQQRANPLTQPPG